MVNYNALLKFWKLCLNYSVLWGQEISSSSNLILMRKIKMEAPPPPHKENPHLDCVLLGLELYVFIRCSNGEHCTKLKMYFGGQKTSTKKWPASVMLQD